MRRIFAFAALAIAVIAMPLTASASNHHPRVGFGPVPTQSPFPYCTPQIEQCQVEYFLHYDYGWVINTNEVWAQPWNGVPTVRFVLTYYVTYKVGGAEYVQGFLISKHCVPERHNPNPPLMPPLRCSMGELTVDGLSRLAVP